MPRSLFARSPNSIQLALLSLFTLADRFDRGALIGDAQHRECVIFSVRDTGSGVATGDLNRSFQPFVQLGSVGRQNKGAGKARLYASSK
jgi:signal transduction histidine kinase